MSALAPLLLGVAVAVAGASRVEAQAQTNPLSLSVRHNTLKNTARPDSALKLRIDSIDAQLAVANRYGRTAEARRLYAKAATLLARREWTPASEFSASVVLRTDQQVIDPSSPWMLRVEQTYAPDIALTRPLTAHAELRQRPPNARGNVPLAVIKSFGTFEGVPRDLRDAPFVIEGDLHDVADGAYVVTVELRDSARVLGTAALPVVVRTGLNATIARLRAAAEQVAEPARSDLLFPVDRLQNINASRITLGTFNAARDFAAAESLLVRIAKDQDPWAGRTGDLKRHYRFAEANEIMPYRLYVPAGYTPSTPLPLIVALHGLGATEDSFFDAYGRKMPALAEQHGYIVVAPLGYRVDGGYGVNLGGSSDPAAAKARELSELDVLNVLAAVRREYTVDSTRIYLMGHSMGAIGTWALGAKYPDSWRALGAFSGFGVASSAPVMAGIPQFVVHGDADPTVPVNGSRVMVAALERAGATVQYIEVAGGNHTNMVEPNLPGMFEFFNTHATRSAQP